MDGQRKMFRMAKRKEGVSMNEVFEKIIEKLEDKRKTAEQLIMENPQDELDRIQTQTAEDFASAYHDAIEIVKQEAEKFGTDTNVGTNGWIPVEEELPETDKYILLSFSNFSIPCVGRYEEDENGGAFYVGDDDETCVSQDMFVNAWMNLPAPYQPKGE